jgi:hypothetical protein
MGCLYKSRHYVAVVCHKLDGSPYYTVVNKKLQVHRHYNDPKQAVMVCRRASSNIIPKDYTDRMKNDIMYLITGIKKEEEPV